jgi:hypothetical protein
MDHLLHTRLCAASEDQSNSASVRELLGEAVYELEQACDIIQSVMSTEAGVFMRRHSVLTQAPVYAKAPKMTALITGEEEMRAMAR